MKKDFINYGIDSDGVLYNLELFQYAKSLVYFSKKTILEKETFGIARVINDIPSISISPSDYLIASKLGVIDFLTANRTCNIIVNNKVKDLIKNPNAYDIKDIYNINKLRRQIFWLFNIWEYSMRCEPRLGAVDFINDLHVQGDKAFNITSRVYVKDDSINGKIWKEKLFRKMLLNNYKENGINFDEIIFCGEKESAIEKRDACIKNNIDIMIEDKSDNAYSISEVAEVLLFDASYNQDCEGENITRIVNYEQAKIFAQAFKSGDKDELNYTKALIKEGARHAN